LGTAMAGMSLGPLVGLPLGGLLFTRIGPRWPFFVSSAWTLLLVVGLAWLPSRLCLCPPRTRRRPLSAWVAFLRPASAVVLGSALLSSLELTLPVHLEEMLGATPEQTGLLLGMAALLYGLSAPLAGWASDRWGGWRVLAGGVAACSDRRVRTNVRTATFRTTAWICAARLNAEDRRRRLVREATYHPSADPRFGKLRPCIPRKWVWRRVPVLPPIGDKQES